MVRTDDRQERERVLLELEHAGSLGVTVDVRGGHVTLSGTSTATRRSWPLGMRPAEAPALSS